MRSQIFARCLPVNAAAYILVICGVACRKPTQSAVLADSESSHPRWFEDFGGTSGFNFTHDTGPAGHYRMPEIMGSGCALFDYDNDGRLDIYCVQNGGPDGAKNQLFHQEPDGTFKDMSAGSGLDVAGWGMGIAVGDVNNDGYPDVLVTEYGRLRLFLNNRDGTFRDVTEESGIGRVGSADHNSEGGPSPPYPWYTGAAFFDYDRDGWLDLVVTRYVAYDAQRACTDKMNRPDYCGPSLFPGAVTKLFHNSGALGIHGAVPQFTDVTFASGLAAEPGPGLGVLCLDFDGDGWPDIFVANDGKPNRLWINRHDGTFVDEAPRRGLAFNALGQAQGNMGIAVGDISGSGRFDLFVTHLGEETNTLYVQRSLGMFADEAAGWGLAEAPFRATGFGTVLADFDNTGRPGLAIANGRVVRADISLQPGTNAGSDSLPAYWQRYAERNFLFANDGHGRFRDISGANPNFCGHANVGRSLAQGDIDNDGGIDLLLTTAGGESRLFRNVASNRGHWLLVRAIDPNWGGRDAIGAQVSLTARGRIQVGYVSSSGSYLCAKDPRVHFGLGNVAIVDRIGVRWPDGTEESFPPAPADQMLTLRHGAGRSP